MIKESGRTGLVDDFTPKKLFSMVGLKQATAIDLAAGRQMYPMVRYKYWSISVELMVTPESSYTCQLASFVMRVGYRLHVQWSRQWK